MFFWDSLVFSITQQMLVIWSLDSSAFSKSSLYIGKLLVHTLLNFYYHFKFVHHQFVQKWYNQVTYFGFPFLSSDVQQQARSRKGGHEIPADWNSCPFWLREVVPFPPQEPTLGRQIQRAVSMAALAMVCEVISQKPELQLDSLDAGPPETFVSSLRLNQTLQKPRTEEESRCVYPLESSMYTKGFLLLMFKNPLLSQSLR